MPNTTAAAAALEELVAELDHVRGIVVAVDALVVFIVHGGCLLLRIKRTSQS